MKLTQLAQSLRDARSEERELTQQEEELACCAGSDGFFYGLGQGYIKPEQWITGKDLKLLQDAIKIVQEFSNIYDELAEEF